jgi:hypothetical protein
MDLTFTNKQTAFRQEIHDWLAVNVPAQPLQTFDTAEGFAQHREWEATLNKGRWGISSRRSTTARGPPCGSTRTVFSCWAPP